MPRFVRYQFPNDEVRAFYTEDEANDIDLEEMANWIAHVEYGIPAGERVKVIEVIDREPRLPTQKIYPLNIRLREATKRRRPKSPLTRPLR